MFRVLWHKGNSSRNSYEEQSLLNFGDVHLREEKKIKFLVTASVIELLTSLHPAMCKLMDSGLFQHASLLFLTNRLSCFSSNSSDAEWGANPWHVWSLFLFIGFFVFLPKSLLVCRTSHGKTLCHWGWRGHVTVNGHHLVKIRMEKMSFLSVGSKYSSVSKSAECFSFEAVKNCVNMPLHIFFCKGSDSRKQNKP